MKLYLDSNVFISLAREEINGRFNLLFKDTELFLTICAKKNFLLLLSFWFFDEVEKIIFLKKEDVFELLKGNYDVSIQEIIKEKHYLPQAKRISRETGIHFADASHIAIALENNASLIISWDKKDFLRTRNLINCLTPKEFVDEFT